jgi:hypothetical protein
MQALCCRLGGRIVVEGLIRVVVWLDVVILVSCVDGSSFGLQIDVNSSALSYGTALIHCPCFWIVSIYTQGTWSV